MVGRPVARSFHPVTGPLGDIMKSIIAALALLGLFAAHSSFAATEQQNKMVTCNKEAAGKKGDERKAFMSECLKAK